jgi:hypothetical protein
MLTRVRKAALLLAWMLSARKRQLPSKRTFSNRRRFVRTRAPRRTWSPTTFEEIDCKLNDWEFKRTFRLSRTVFNEVHDRIAHRLRCNETLRKNASGGTVVDTRIKLMIALRWLGGGSYLDLRLLYMVPTPSLYRIVHNVVDAVNDEYFNEDLVFPIGNLAKLAQIQEGFDAMTGGTMEGCVGAIDGIVIRIHGPSFAESNGNPRQYYNRKGFFGLVCLAVCDSRKKFTSMSMKCPGSTNDSIAWRLSDLGTRVISGKLPEGMFLNGDEAFPCTESMISPFPGRVMSIAMDAFNYWQSHLRIKIECAFGELIGRWGIFWRALRGALSRHSRIVAACMILHNRCVDHRDPVPSSFPPKHPLARTAIPAALTDAELRDSQQGRRADLDKSCKRKLCMRQLYHKGMGRPAHSTHSRACASYANSDSD